MVKSKTGSDMTVGSPFRHILLFAIPVFLSNLFQQIYTVADTAIVSRTLGDQALAAVGSIGSVNFLILGFCNGMGMGFAVPIAQCFGAKDYPAMRRYAGNAVWVYTVISVIFTVSSAALCMPILKVTQTPPEIIEMAYRYLIVIFLGIPVQFAYNTLSAMIRSLGDSKTPLYLLIAASLLNIALDLIFILSFSLGTMGAALATVLSQLFSVVGCLVLIRLRIPELCLTKEDLQPRRKYLSGLIKNGLPMGLQMSVTGIGSILLQTSVNMLGATAVASIVAAERICNMLAVVTMSLGSAMTVYCGQNLGARQYQRIETGIQTGVLTGLVFSGAAFLILWRFGRILELIFLNAASVTLIEMTYKYLFITAAFLWAQSLIFTVRFSLQGLGRAQIALAACLLEMIARSSFGLFFVPKFGFSAACFSSPAAWVMADLLLVPACLLILKRMKHLSAAEQ